MPDFFLLGRGRSGTTLLQKRLNEYTSAAVAPECLFILYLEKKYRSKVFDKETVRSFVADIWKEDRILGWGLCKKELENFLLDKDIGSFEYAANSVYEFYSLKVGKKASCLGDKNPLYTLFADRLMGLFPAAKFIGIIREPRDNVASYIKAPFDLNDSCALAYRWKLYNEKLLKFHKENSERVMLVEYSEIVDPDSDLMERVAVFLGVEHTGDKKHEMSISASMKNWHKQLSGELNKNNIGNRRHFLTVITFGVYIWGYCI